MREDAGYEKAMTVKEIFDLRRQGKIEEAYDAIRPMYAVHKGKYTTLCMFWTASDILKKRIAEGRLEEARKIFLALQRMLPRIKEIEEQSAQEKTLPAANGLPAAMGTSSVPGERAFAFMALAEKRLNEAEGASLISPIGPISEDPPMFDEGPGPQQEIDVRAIQGINVPQRIVLGFVAANPECNIASMSYSLGMPEESVEKHVNTLVERGLIERRDANKNGGGYVVIK